jgi:tRNA threonylcarbamoyladenosine biosynthesis protein TsaB
MSSEKPILAIETSESTCAAAVYFSGEKYFEVNIKLKNSHAEKLFEVIDYIISSAGTSLKDFDSIAVSAGPGSFTGLRIGMSAAKGLAFGASLPLIIVPTFEALALQLSSFLPLHSEFAIANRVNSQELYFAKFKVLTNSYIFTSDLIIINREELENKRGGILLFGNASDEETERYSISRPGAEFVAKWAESFGKKVFDFDYIEPNYFKNFKLRK